MSRRDRNETGGLIASDRVEGTAVYDRNGNRLGSIENFMVGKRSGRVEYAVLSFGGFLGMGERHYPLPWDELDYDEDENGYVVNITERDLEDAPSHRAGDQIDYGRGYGADVRHYYGGH
ncbi:PRC-barrel domain-containing protein [Qipengyuania sp. JC766]|uniref:PRC-barrel domain-containing protein n=1 Tax=Qipengyuania sp. JC766 TaxID=3232139 RepID=UPI003458DDDF